MHATSRGDTVMTTDPTRPPKVAPPTGWFTTSDGAEIPYRIKGSGPALVMVHGWSQSGAMFQHQLDGLSDRYTVVVPDVRGHGEAPEPSGGLRMSRLGRDLAELIDHLGLERVHLLGWSMGVSVVWAYVDLFGTADVERFVFVDQPAMLTVLPEMDEAERADCGTLFGWQQVEDLCAVLRTPEAAATLAGFVGSMVTPTISPALLEWILAEDAKTLPHVASHLLFSHCTNDWRDVLGRIDRPTLVIGGSVSHVDPRSQRYIHRRIPGSVYHEFGADEGGAHFPFLEAPDAFNRVVGNFLDAR